MRKPALIVVGCVALVTGAMAQDSATPTPVAPSANVVFAAGDKLHGYLRGGETHALQVHLAKGDVYSFAAASAHGSSLLLHLSLRDPNGVEINADANARHLSQGRRVAVGPFRAPATGTYVLDFSGDGTYLNRGDYAATSKLKIARSVYSLPADGSPVDVEVPAGATLKVRAKNGLSTLSMGLPGQSANSFAPTDPLVVSLRANGIASSATGTYRFAAQDAPGATLSVARVNWTPIEVAAPTFPELSADQIPAGFRYPTIDIPAPVTSSNSTPALQTVAPPVPVGLTPVFGGHTLTTMFVSADIDAAGALANHVHMPDGTVGFAGGTTDAVLSPSPVVDTPGAPPISSGDAQTPPTSPVVLDDGYAPPVAPPRADRVSVSAGGPLADGVPTNDWTDPFPAWQSCATMVGKSLLFGNWNFRNTPWAAHPRSYPAAVGAAILSSDVRISEDAGAATTGDSSDPFETRAFRLSTGWGGGPPVDGSLTTTTRYFVDGHQVASLLASGGDTTVSWDVAGSGTLNGAPWSLSGSWRSVMHPTDVMPSTTSPNLYVYGDYGTAPLPSCTITGSETFVSGSASESLSLDYHLNPYTAPSAYDPSGLVKNSLSVPDAGLRQTISRTFFARDLVRGIDRWFPVEIVVTTSDPTTPGAVVDDWWTTLILC